MIDERELKYILQAQEDGSFSQAARHLFVSQPSLSQCIRKVEQEAGTELFHRNASSLQLTEAGKVYVRKARQIMEIRRALLREIEDLSDLKRGHLCIGTSHSRTAYLLTRVLPVFRSRFPGIGIQLVEGNTVALQRYAMEGRVDLSFVYLPLQEAELSYEAITDEKIVLALPRTHRLCSGLGEQKRPYPALSFAKLADEPFIIMKRRRKMREIYFQLCELTHTSPSVVLESDSLVSAQLLTAAGLGATLLTDTLADYNKLAGDPYYFSLQEKTEPRHLVAAYPKHILLSKAARAFIRLVQELL